MALEEIVDSLEKVDEKYHDLYVENADGKFEVSIVGLKSALTKERLAKKELEKKLKVKDDDSGDPDIEELKKELKQAKEAIVNNKIFDKIKSSAIAAGVDPNYVDDVVQLTRASFSIGDDGKVAFVDADGVQQKSVESFFKIDFKKSKPRYFLNSGRKGGGASDSEDTIPLSFNGKLEKAIKTKDTKSLVKLKQSGN